MTAAPPVARRAVTFALALALALAALAGLAALLTTSPVASAHGGDVVLEQTKGAYSVTVQASATTEGGRQLVDLTTYLIRQDLGSPDTDATVTLIVDDGERRRTLKPEMTGDGYEVLLPGERGEWRSWSYEVRVRGAAGSSVVRAGAQRVDDGAPGWLVPVSVAVALALLAALVLARRRRDGDPGDDDVDGDSGDDEVDHERVGGGGDQPPASSAPSSGGAGA